MVDVVWAASLAVCAVVFLTMTIYFHKKNQAELEAEEEERKHKHSKAVTTAIGGSGGKKLHLSPEEIQRDLDRLCLLFSHSTEPARKREAPKPPPEAPKPPPAAPKEVPKPPPAAPKEVPKPPPAARKEVPKPPVEITQKPAEAQTHPTGPLKTERKARAEAPKGSSHIQSEIEQAVKETQ